MWNLKKKKKKQGVYRYALRLLWNQFFTPVSRIFYHPMCIHVKNQFWTRECIGAELAKPVFNNGQGILSIQGGNTIEIVQ